jgi:predicted nucleotidyltransferase
LATVDGGTAQGVLIEAHRQGKKIHVLVDETRPRLQGARLTAWEMMQNGVPMTLIADNASGYYLHKGGVNAAFVGADRVAANGDVANKIGTYKLAVVAKENNVPFYAVMPLSTIDMSLPTGDDIPIEQRSADEVTTIDGVRIAPEGVNVGNPAFDVTPHQYITALVTEKGVVYPPFTENLLRIMDAPESEQERSLNQNIVLPNAFEQDIRRAVQILKEEGCSEIYIFGSAAKGKIRDGSDLDLAVRGCPPGKFFDVLGRLLFELDHPVDLVSLDTSDPSARWIEENAGLVQIG